MRWGLRVQYRPSSPYFPTTHKSNPFFDGRMHFKLEISLAFGVCEVHVQHIVHFILQCDVLFQLDDTHTHPSCSTTSFAGRFTLLNMYRLRWNDVCLAQWVQLYLLLLYVTKARNNVSQDGIHYLHDRMDARVQTFLNDYVGYTGYYVVWVSLILKYLYTLISTYDDLLQFKFIIYMFNLE